MAERKEEEELDSRILTFFKKSCAKGHIMLTIPDIAAELKVDRRRIEPPLAVLSRGKSPRLVEIKKSRVKYFVLKEIIDFCQKLVEVKE